MIGSYKARVALAATFLFSAGALAAADSRSTQESASPKRNLEPQTKTVADYSTNVDERAALIAVCRAGRVASGSLQACVNAYTSLVDDVRSRIPPSGGCPLAVC